MGISRLSKYTVIFLDCCSMSSHVGGSTTTLPHDLRSIPRSLGRLKFHHRKRRPSIARRRCASHTRHPRCCCLHWAKSNAASVPPASGSWCRPQHGASRRARDAETGRNDRSASPNARRIRRPGYHTVDPGQSTWISCPSDENVFSRGSRSSSTFIFKNHRNFVTFPKYC